MSTTSVKRGGASVVTPRAASRVFLRLFARVHLLRKAELVVKNPDFNEPDKRAKVTRPLRSGLFGRSDTRDVIILN